MSNSYLLEIIKSLSKDKCQEFSVFLDSSIFNNGKSSQELKELWSLIIKSAPEYDDSKLSKSVAYQQIYPNQPFISGKLDKLMVELNKLLRNFLLLKQYLSEENEHAIQLDWVKWLRNSRLNSRAYMALEKTKKQIKDFSKESIESYKLKVTVAEEEHELQSIQNQVQGDLNIPELIYHLDRYYTSYRIELTNRYHLQQKGMPLPEIKLNNDGIDFWANESLLVKLSLKVGALLTNEHPTPEAFSDFLALLKSVETELNFQTSSQYYAYLRSLCTLLINSGRIEFALILHQIHQDNLERGLFFIDNEIASHAYTNIVHIAIRVKEYQWALEFTEKYKKRIIGGDPNQFFYQMNLSLCLFALKRYDEAITNLPDPSLHLHYQGTIRCLELKIYYEMQSDLLLYKMYAFRKYFERTATKTVSTTLRTMYIEFFNIMLQLTQSPPKDKKRSQQLIDRINKKKLLADRAWLLEKARELG